MKRIKKVKQSFDNFNTGMVFVAKLYDLIPTMKVDEVLPFLVDLTSKGKLTEEDKLEIEAMILNNSLNFENKFVRIPVLVKKEDDIFKLYFINKNIRKSFSSLMCIETKTPNEIIDVKTKLPYWFLKSLPALAKEVGIEKENIYVIKNITFEKYGNLEESFVELEYIYQNEKDKNEEYKECKECKE